MNILIVSATQFEIQPLLDFLKIEQAVFGLNQSHIDINGNNIKILITGVGMVYTAFMLGRYNNSSYDLALNVGVCGAFSKQLELGQLVHITNDVISELGAEDGDDFLTYNKLNLPGEYLFSSVIDNLFPTITALKVVKGITVNTIHGNDESIQKVMQLYHPDVETMEGAAFFAGCLQTNKTFTQIRAISNYVEKRDKSKWKMPLAINNLNDFLINFIQNTN
jgi:futalosine hydrolase